MGLILRQLIQKPCLDLIYFVQYRTVCQSSSSADLSWNSKVCRKLLNC